MDEKVILQTERLTIEPMTNDELQYMVEKNKESNPELSQAFQEMQNGCLTYPEQRVWFVPWKMCRKNDGEKVGDAAFKGLFENGIVEIGYGIDPGYENQGYITEGVGALLKWAQKQKGVKEIQAEACVGNAASLRVLEKLGFQTNGDIGEEGPRFTLR